MAKEVQNWVCFALVEEEDLWLANQLNVSAFESIDSGVFVVPSLALFLQTKALKVTLLH